MAAFVGAVPLTVSTFTSRFPSAYADTRNERVQPARSPARQTPTMTILSGLDTVNTDSYTFSRFILGPFQPKVLNPGSSEGDREIHLRAAYRHIFGNAYLMEEERAELAVPESQYKAGNISAREFVRCLAKSSAYKKRFLDGASQFRFIELNFMHLLGRAPDTRKDISEHLAIYATQGVDADIDSYIDSEEYSSVFGDDTIPFLRFRGAYTPCESFNKQCALKGGWANSDKAMGGAALSGYNGADGKQFCQNISSYISAEPTPYEQVAENTPLKSTAPNWYACPNPAVEPQPGFVSVAEVRALEETVAALQSQYDAELEKKLNTPRDPLAFYRGMISDMGAMLDRGPAYSGGDPLLANPYAKQMGSESPLTDAGQKSSDYKRFMSQLENDTLSRTEKDLEEAKASLRVLSVALASSTPVTPTVELPGQVSSGVTTAVADQTTTARPRVSAAPRKPRSVAQPKSEGGLKVGPVTLPSVSLPSVSLPSVSLPFGKK
ncbi:Phycobilisome 32.1 kDa linker polypeptide, phycocyanin-associated, rod [Gracilariopsis chorda]|uniref:Phycobilisome 32.1 kDa linker polypeptide, phycocyanin-associated, rod n=1 Tax=Gracilariopsis chorda TaxID=448386 RepID=A0A2V3ICK5_9FLOR|nr:Phycobilisome 32.1 kDa linker polypeptide, phycocyanin-associated, rod [Gracilariopsis chorda]|eukprot:PXF39827.1 Phycobilisome 32.1 kDa linker polypeptide, phycocyanin-associated, rod [Gracilariopsis chorda]